MKKLFSSILAIVLVMGSLNGVVLAEETGVYVDLAQQLRSIDVFKGTGSGFELNRAPTRIEGGVMFVRLLGGEQEAMDHMYSHPFADVPTWADPYVGYLWHYGLTKGVTVDQFGSKDVMIAKSYMTFLLRALGYDDSAGDFSWGEALAKGKTIGLIDGDLYSTLTSVVFLRDHVAKLSYEVLKQKVKAGDMTLARKLIASGALVEEIAIEIGVVAGGGGEIPKIPEVSNITKEGNFGRKSLGVVDVIYNTSSTKKIKLIIEHDGQRYIYNIKSEARYVTFPLQLGNGSYSLKIYENTSGTKYRTVYSTSGTVSLKDKTIVYLNSIQQIEWFNDDQTIIFAQKLLNQYALDTYGINGEDNIKTLPANLKITDREIIDLYYQWVVQNVVYDYDKIKTLSYDYVPNVDMIFDAKSGICYDYSVLLASMLRSQGIPSKLIKGYTSWTSVYHAWNEIYLEETDEWVVVDTTYDSYLYLRNRKYDFEKSREVYSTSYYY